MALAFSQSPPIRGMGGYGMTAASRQLMEKCKRARPFQSIRKNLNLRRKSID
jgi:hypothetical protein